MATELTTSEIATLEWWTVRELANRWRCDPSTITKRCNEDLDFARKLPGGWRIHKSTIDRVEKLGQQQEVKQAVRRVIRSTRHATWVPKKDHYADC